MGPIASQGAQSQALCKVGFYRGQLIALKYIQKEHMQISRAMLLEFNRVRG